MIASLILSGLFTLSAIHNTPIVNSTLFQYLNRTISSAYQRLPVRDSTPEPTYNASIVDIYALLDSLGYSHESHYVTTEDGYILLMHRITGSPNNSPFHSDWESKPVALLMHGLESSSRDWVLKGPNESLPLNLADANWDVWLGNNRGNVFSRNHTTLDPDTDLDYWNFSFDECGNYDVPAFIDYIQKIRQNEKIFYVGHSQGTTQYFAFASLRPEYNEKIALMTALAPVVYMKDVGSPVVQLLCKYLDTLESLASLINLREIGAASTEQAEQLTELCVANPDICFFVISIASGFDRAQQDNSILPKFLFSFPAGISIRMLVHYGQEVLSGYYRRFDYGKSGNLDKYKTPHPPEYNLSLVTSPVALYYSQNDLLSPVVGVDTLASALPNVVKKKLNEVTFFTHLDYIIAKDVGDLLYNEVITDMTSYAMQRNYTVNGGTISTVNSFIFATVAACAIFVI